MIRICANITLLFKELPFLDRVEAAAEAGFDGLEILFPYDQPVPQLLHRMQRAGLPLALINAPPPNYAGGTPGYSAVPGGEARFRHDFQRVLRYAQRLAPQHIHVMAGEAEGPAARDAFIANLKWAAAEAPEQSLTIEPLNPFDMPGYFLVDYDLAAQVLDAVDAPNVALQYDSYHAQRITGDALAVWQAHGHRARHIQLGDTPDRRDPGTGGVDFSALFAAIRDSGYDGWISAEYHPAGDTVAGLGWLAGARKALGC